MLRQPEMQTRITLEDVMDETVHSNAAGLDELELEKRAASLVGRSPVRTTQRREFGKNVAGREAPSTSARCR